MDGPKGGKKDSKSKKTRSKKNENEEDEDVDVENEEFNDKDYCHLCDKNISKFYMKQHIEMVHGQLLFREKRPRSRGSKSENESPIQVNLCQKLLFFIN